MQVNAAHAAARMWDSPGSLKAYAPRPQFSVGQLRPSQSAKMQLTYRVGADGVAEVEQAFAAERPTCQAALGHVKKQDKTVALDSPFKRLSSG